MLGTFGGTGALYDGREPVWAKNKKAREVLAPAEKAARTTVPPPHAPSAFGQKMAGNAHIVGKALKEPSANFAL